MYLSPRVHFQVKISEKGREWERKKKAKKKKMTKTTTTSIASYRVRITNENESKRCGQMAILFGLRFSVDFVIFCWLLLLLWLLLICSLDRMYGYVCLLSDEYCGIGKLCSRVVPGLTREMFARQLSDMSSRQSVFIHIDVVCVRLSLLVAGIMNECACAAECRMLC